MISHARLRRKPDGTLSVARHYELVAEESGRDGRVLKLDLLLEPLDSGEHPPWRATLEVGGTPHAGNEGCDGEDSMAALRRLADWTRRAADALDMIVGPNSKIKTEIVAIHAENKT